MVFEQGKKLIESNFGPTQKCLIATGDEVLSGLSVAVAGLAGRDFLNAHILAIVNEGNALCIKVDSPKYDIVPQPHGPPTRKLKALSTYKLYYFERCDFEKSLQLLDAFNVVPVVEKREQAVSQSILESVKNFLRGVKARHRILLDEFGEGYVQAREIGPKSAGWKEEIKSVLAFNRALRGLPYDGVEEAGYLDQCATHRFFVIWCR